MNQEVLNIFNPVQAAPTFDQIRIALASPGKDPLVVVRRDQEARNHQLPDVQARA